MLDGQHLRVIQTFVRDLPEAVPVDTVEKAERFLARQAVKLRPDQLEKVAHQWRCGSIPTGSSLTPTARASEASRGVVSAPMG